MPREPRPTQSLLPATLAAVAGGALVGGLLFASVLKGPLALVVLAVLGIALPVARTLAERVVVLMVGYAGILFSLWMLPLPLPHGDLLGAAIGAGFGWSLVRGLQTGRLNRLVPQVGAPDVVAVLGAAIASAYSLRALINLKSAPFAYNYYQSQWDNSSHYYIVTVMRAGRELIRYQGAAPDGSRLNFVEYPAAYHAVNESVVTFLLGHGTATATADLVAFLRSTGLLGVACAVLVACAVASLPSIRANVFTSAIGPGLAGAVMIAGPGAFGIVDAQYNFPFALAMVVAASVLAIRLERVWELKTLALLISAVVCAAGSWLPMGVLAGLMAVAGVVLPWSRQRWSGERRHIVVGLGLAAVGFVICLLQALWVTATVESGLLMQAVGGLTRALSPQVTLAVFLVFVAVGWAWWSARRTPPAVLRLGAVGLSLVGFGILSTAMAVTQYRALGAVRYYPAKMLNGFVTLGLVYAAITIAIAGAIISATVKPGLTARAFATALGVTALTVHGLPLPSPVLGATEPTVPATLLTQVRSRPAFAQAALAASDVARERYTVILIGSETRFVTQDTALVASLRGTYSYGTSMLLLRLVQADPKSPADVAAVISEDMRAGRVTIVASAENAAQIRSALGTIAPGALITL